MRYLLDTNILSDLVRHPQGRIAEHIREVGEAQIYGAAKSGSPRLAHGAAL